MSVAWLLSALGCPANPVSPDPPEGASDDDDGDDDDDEPDVDETPTSGPTTTATTGTDTGTGEPGPASSETTDAATDSDTSATETTATSVPSGTCGDGVVDPGETCDLTYAENKDTGACTKSCQLPYCGDGLVWEGEESCDNGMANNDFLYGGCRENCTPGPSCNDGLLQPEEECDASAPAAEGAVGCDPGNCRMMARVAFVTAAEFSGDLGGLAGADATCVAAAAAAKLDNAGSFLAYMGDGAAAPANRFVDGLADKGYPYARRDGQKLANDLDDLFDIGLRVPLVITELGTTLPPEQLAWTGVDIHGEPGGAHCEAWSTDYFKYSGRVGQISPATDSDADIFAWKINGDWVDYASKSCFTNDARHLYCFED
ncbi:MAG TPA: hypothetical protein VGB85_23505 [Nannocystis sp.]|jgi:hypothetical protein